MIALVDSLVKTFAPWQSLYGDSKAVSAAVTSVHLVAMLFGGGYAVAADRAVLRARPATSLDAARLLGEIQALHLPVVIALTVLSLSGLAMAAADVETFAHSPVFAAKLAIIVLLLVNGLLLLRTERALRRIIEPGLQAGGGMTTELRSQWRRLRGNAWASAALWTAAVVVGVVLTNAA